MADLIFSTTERDESHAKLAESLTQYPLAECREDHALADPYQVWSGPADAAPSVPLTDDEQARLVADQITHPSIIDAIAEKVAEKLAEAKD